VTAADSHSRRPSPTRRQLQLAAGYVLAFALCGGAIAALTAAVEQAQQRQGIRTGFDFLFQPANFQIAESLLSVTPTDSYALVILAGLVNTLMVAALAVPAASLLGIGIGLLRFFGPPLLARATAGFIEVFRNTPVLLQLFVWYGLLLQLPPAREALQLLPGIFLSNRGLMLPAIAWTPWPQLDLPALQGFSFTGGWQISPELAALVFGLALFHAAYIAEIIRAAIAAIPVGQVEAAQSIGLPKALILRFVLLPHVRRISIPPLANQYLALLKNSSLAVAIGYPDLMAVINTAINQTGQAIEGSALVLGLYLAISLSVAGLLNFYNQRLSRAALLTESGEQLAGRRQHHAPSRVIQAITAVILILLASLTLRWGLLDAAWSGGAAACQSAAGACWAVLAEKFRLLLFGTMPETARPRAIAAIAIIGLGLGALVYRRLPLLHRALVTGLLMIAAPVLLQGSLLGWTPLPIADWGGLVVTVLLAAYSNLLAMPLALPLALARRAGQPWLRVPATLLIETVRGVPLIILLFVIASILPLLFSGGWSLAKAAIALIALTLHTAANLAEVLRGALQAIPPGQAEAARALGLHPWHGFRLVIWPQALRIAIPAGLGTCIGAIKDTSLVLVIGVFDLMSAAKATVADIAWRPYALEVYLAVAAFYFIVCYLLSLQATRLQHRLSPSYWRCQP